MPVFHTQMCNLFHTKPINPWCNLLFNALLHPKVSLSIHEHSHVLFLLCDFRYAHAEYSYKSRFCNGIKKNIQFTPNKVHISPYKSTLLNSQNAFDVIRMELKHNTLIIPVRRIFVRNTRTPHITHLFCMCGIFLPASSTWGSIL